MKVNTVTRKFVLVLILSLILPTAVGHATNHKPTLAQIEAAKKAEAAKKKAAADALKRLERARGNLRALTAIAKAADAKYLAARNELARATAKSNAATKVYEEAVASVAFTHREIGKLAVHAYRTGGGLTDIEMLLDASGPQEIIDRISTLDNLGATNKTALSRFKSAEEKAQKAKVLPMLLVKNNELSQFGWQMLRKRQMMLDQNSKKRLINYKRFKTSYNVI
jgi:peptidoglycan DL-endopeptidase CwlO